MLPILILLFFVDTSSSFHVTIDYNISNCYNSTYKSTSTYETNLNNLISTLVTQISTSKNGFMTHKQASENNHNPVYGLAMCRGDLDSEDCRACVEMASKQVRAECPRAIEAIFWKEQCIIRYSNKSFFSLPQTQPNFVMANSSSITVSVDAWTRLLTSTLSNVTAMAASNESGYLYATKEVWFSPLNNTLSTMAQCTPDLTKDNCTSCLDATNPHIQRAILRQGQVLLMPSCTLRYEMYPFYQFPSLSPPTNILTIANTGKKKGHATKIIVAIIVPLVVVGMVIALIGTYFFRKKAKKYQPEDARIVLEDLKTAESLMFELGALEAATKNFSDDQKLGQGGFGSVYKGTLPNGQEIAVKRLARISSQGVGEFKNEVVLIANLQHRNLVRLLGFCLAGVEKLLVYEFVPNKSLNYFLFGEGKQTELNWSKRYNIIKGVARGLLYLHEDSRPRIIHRDLKSGNILLDANMNPKISDFGLARIFKAEQKEDNTNRVVGTYGYMAPEYAMHGQFSVKSDVYSFGLLLLEIVSGKKSTAKVNPSRDGDFLTHAWKCLTQQKLLDFMDPTLLGDSYSSEEVMLCIHLGLLCAQENTNDRPTMSFIVQMLNTESTTSSTLPIPQCPRSFYYSSTESSLVSMLSPQSMTSMSSNNGHLMPLPENQVTMDQRD